MKTKSFWSAHWITVVAASVCLAQGGDQMTKNPLGAQLPTYEAPGTAAVKQEPEGELKLRDALAMSLMHNPELAGFSWEVRAREAAILQAGVWSNPELDLELENVVGGGDFEGIDAAETTLILSQIVPFGGKRGKRREVARLGSHIADWDYETARIETYAATVDKFVTVLAAQEQLALTERLVEVARDIGAAVSARVGAGGTLALEENRARVAVETSLIEESLAERDLTIARRELVSMWGSDVVRFSRAVGNLAHMGDGLPALDDLHALVDRNPQVARWTTELALRRARVNLIRASRTPDLTISAGIRHDNAADDVGFVFSLTSPLPTWDRKTGSIREAEHVAARAEPMRHAAATNIRRQIAVAYETLAGANDELVRLRDRVLPEAEAAADRSGDAYRAGAIQLTDVLDIQRTFFRLRLRYVRALARYHTAIATLEGLTGSPLTDIGESTDDNGGER